MNLKRWIHTIMICVLVSLISMPSNAYAQSRVRYEIVKSRAIGHYIQLDLKNEGTSLQAHLTKSNRSGTTSFSSSGYWWIEGRNITGSKSAWWGPYEYNAGRNNREYIKVFRPAERLGDGEMEYQIHLCSRNDGPCNPYSGNYNKKTGYAVAETICPYEWSTGLRRCDW